MGEWGGGRGVGGMGRGSEKGRGWGKGRTFMEWSNGTVPLGIRAYKVPFAYIGCLSSDDYSAPVFIPFAAGSSRKLHLMERFVRMILLFDPRPANNVPESSSLTCTLCDLPQMPIYVHAYLLLLSN